MEPFAMKTATLPSLRVEPELREAAESVLQEGETLSGFIEASVRETVERRRTRAEFIARGLASREEARRTGEFYPAREVHAELARMLEGARAKLRGKAVPKAKARG
jgi:predicted transcriptional regulator